jgi:hypothetical protein
MSELTPKQVAQIEAALAAGWKIEAIKIYREATGKGLREAKDAIEALIPELIERDPQKYSKLTLAHADTMPSNPGCAIPFALAGAILCFVCIYKVVDPMVGTQRVIGTVVAIESPPAESGTVTAPVVEYEVGDRLYRVKGADSDLPSRKIGDRVPVLYKEHDPSDGRIDSFPDRWFLPLVLGGSGVVMLAVSYLVWRGARRRRRGLESAARAAEE